MVSGNKQGAKLMKKKKCACGTKMKMDKCGSKLKKAKKHQLGGILQAMQKFQNGGSLNSIPFLKKGKPVTKFGVFGQHPEKAGRTPQWDSEENKIFNEKSDAEYLNKENIKYTKEGNYYLNEHGKYLPGIIYHSPDGQNWNHYQLNTGNFNGYDMFNLTPEQYQQIIDVGLDYTKFYRTPERAEFYRPNPELKSKLPQSEKRIGNTIITYSNNQEVPENLSKRTFQNYDDYGSYSIKDPDNGYDFTIRSGRLRDGGSRTIKLEGNYPKEWDQYKGIIRYGGFGKDDGSAEKRRQQLNNVLKSYGIQFDKKGGILNK